MNTISEIQARSYPKYKELGERTLEIIAPTGSSEAPLEISCRLEALGAFVENVVTTRARKAVEKIPVDTLMNSGGGEVLRTTMIMNIGRHYEMFGGIREDLARVTAALNGEGLWDKIKEVVDSAPDAEAYFNAKKAADLQIAQNEQRAAWKDLVAPSFPETDTIKPLPLTSREELLKAQEWMNKVAIPVAKADGSIAQNTSNTPLFNEINDRLLAMRGKPILEKVKIAGDISICIETALAV